MSSSFLRSVALPPPFSEELSPAQWGVVNRIRLLFAVLAIGIDVMLWAGLRHVDRVDEDVLTTFAMVNIPLLVLDVGVMVGQLRWASWRSLWVLQASMVVEAFTVIVWVQATGTLTTYFVLVGAIFILFYRLYVGFRPALVMTAALFLFHGGAVCLELMGILVPEPLFRGPLSMAYTVPLYQAIVIWSIVWIYAVMFLGANAIVNKLREKDRALAEVREEVERVAEDARHGRLTGKLVAEEYALGELLGRGGVGEIYMARRISDDATVAVKVLHAHFGADSTMLERFRREAKLAEALPHSYTARVYAVGRDPREHLDFIVMEYLRGEDLSAFLRRRGPLAIDELMPILRGLADALDAAHAAGIVHRDIKPQNVFLVEAGEDGQAPQVRLLDFGMSKLLDSDEQTLTKADAVIGTVAFMSPEQALGKMDQIGPASDRFAFGAVAYRAITGKLPFHAGDLLGAIREVVHVHPSPPTSFRPRLHTDINLVFAIALAKAPDERYQSATAFVDDLEAALDGRLPAGRRAQAESIHTGAGEAATMTAEV